MPHRRHLLLAILALATLAPAQIRVPAEWEPHAATWMQWPYGFENSYRPDFAGIIDILQAHEPVKLIVKNGMQANQAQSYLANNGVPTANISFLVQNNDNAWMRDNGPVWVTKNGLPHLHDWGFDGWGQEVPNWTNDDAIPAFVSAQTGIPAIDYNSYIVERGALEFNGRGILITTWPVFLDRNPGITRAFAASGLKKTFGLSRVIWLESVPSDDFTGGHVDGIARFIDPNTVVVARYVNQNHPDAAVYEEAATIIANAGLEVLRLDIPGSINYFGFQMDANYMNWYVANGVVIVCGFNHPTWDEAARSQIATWFPDRVAVVTDTREIWSWGGGVHCVTNDQPLFP